MIFILISMVTRLRFRGPIRVHPPGGWTWEEAGFKFNGTSPEDLAGKIKTAREMNRREIGNPFDEVEELYCKKFPGMGVEVMEDVKPDLRSNGLKDRVMAWLVGVSAKENPKFAHVGTVRSRAEICAACPMNVNVDDWDINRRVMLISRGASTEFRTLGGCLCHSWHNKCAVLFDDAGTKREDQPAACWAGLSP